MIVKKYEKAFPGAVSSLLERTYVVSLNGDDFVSELENLTDVDFAELIGTPEFLFEPDDTYYTDGGIGFSYLQLVRANKAWDITTGDPKVYIGVSDAGIDINHEDLAGKFVYADFVTTTSSHGTWTSGFISPLTNNDKGVSGIGYNTKMIGILTGASSIFQLAQVPGVRVINASWANGCDTPSRVESAVYYEIRNILDVLVVAAAGNGSTCGGPNHYVYPAAYNNVLSVSSVGHTYPIGEAQMKYQKDVHQRYIDPVNPEDNTHQHNDKVDIVAPGFDLRTTDYGSNYKYIFHGTSSAAPQVAAAAGLIYSINPHLTANEVEGILKNTADDIYWIPYNYPYLGKLGSGRLNVFRAVKETECIDEVNPIIDLVVRDSNEDIGIEPNIQTIGSFWKSNDIWIRNQQDGKYYYETDQTINYNSTNPNYVYVRVTNYGCEVSGGNDELTLSWAASTISHPFPEDGIDNTHGLVGTKIIPPLAPGQEVIIEFEWYPPNPDDFPPVFESVDELNASLVARIISDDDPISYPTSSNIVNYVKNNNNVAWKNVNIINVSPTSPLLSSKFFVYNSTDEDQTFNIELSESKGTANLPLYEEAEISIKMDSIIYASWLMGNSSADNIKLTNFPEVKLLSGQQSELKNITLQSGEIGGIEIFFNFLTKKMTNTDSFEYDIVQRDALSGNIVGGGTILINKSNRQIFSANAQKENNNNQTFLAANDIGEPALYNWYDSEGNLLYTGREYVISPEISETYSLEVISNLDGFKDYQVINVEGISPFSLGTISPNPAGSQISVGYEISEADSAYLIITSLADGTYNNYILDLNSNQRLIDLTNYPNGIYLVTLVCNGQTVKSKNLIKN